MQITTDDGQQIQVEPVMAPVLLALLEQQRAAARVGFGTILVHFSPRAAKVSVWKKIEEDGAK